MIFPKLKERIIEIPWWFGFAGLALYPFIFDVKKRVDKKHERVHLKQQEPYWQWAGPLGLLAWLFLYFCVLPYKWHPFRTKWELEAYTKGSGYSKKKAQRIIDQEYFKRNETKKS